MRGIKHVVWFVILSLSLVMHAYADNPKLVIVGESWPPFEFEENDKVVGIDADIAQHIFKKMNIPVEMRVMPWARAWAMIEKGEADAAFSTSRKDTREPYVYYPKEDMWTSEFVFFTRRDQKLPQLHGYDDAKAKNLRIGIVRGQSYNDAFWKAFPRDAEGKFHPQLQAARDAEVNFHKLARGRIDLYIIDKTVGLYTLAKMKLQDDIVYYEAPLFAKGYPMPFAKKSTYPNLATIASRFEQELIALKTSGEYQQIRDKWLK